jgi:Ca2+-binding EF-hand superfamily protein
VIVSHQIPAENVTDTSKRKVVDKADFVDILQVVPINQSVAESRKISNQANDGKTEAGN